jgi:hypothetical protein
MFGKCYVLEDFLDPDGVSFFIWYLYSHESETRDRSLYSYGFCLECKCEIFLQCFDLGESDSLVGFESILYHRRSYTLILHLDIDAELEKCLLYEE